MPTTSPSSTAEETEDPEPTAPMLSVVIPCLLSIIGLREKRPQETQQWLTELARDYPQNRLFRKELAKVNAKLGFNAN